VTTPAALTHSVRVIGTMNDSGSAGLAFYNRDLYDLEKTNASVIYNSTVCSGTCTPLFLGILLSVPTGIAADANFVYIGDNGHVWRYDPVANTFTNLADTGLVNGVATLFGAIGGIALDTNHRVFAADTSVLWEITSGPHLTGIVPGSGTRGSSVPVTITGSGLTGATLNMPTVTTPTGVSVISAPVTGVTVTATQITATFVVANDAPLSTQIFTITTPAGTSNPLSFAIVASLPTINAMSPSIGAPGASVNVTLTGTNLTGATAINAGPGITVSNLAVVSATQATATFAIGASAATGAQNVTITTPGGTSAANPGAVFTINPPAPTLSSITPASGKANSTQGVKIIGTNFNGATVTVSGGDITVTNFKLANATEIDANFVIPAGATPGPRTVSVTTPGGTASLTFSVN